MSLERFSQYHWGVMQGQPFFGRQTLPYPTRGFEDAGNCVIQRRMADVKQTLDPTQVIDDHRDPCNVSWNRGRGRNCLEGSPSRGVDEVLVDARHCQSWRMERSIETIGQDKIYRIRSSSKIGMTQNSRETLSSVGRGDLRSSRVDQDFTLHESGTVK